MRLRIQLGTGKHHQPSYVGELREVTLSLNDNSLAIDQIAKISDWSLQLKNGTRINIHELLRGRIVLGVEGLSAPVVIDASEIYSLDILEDSQSKR